MALWDRLLYGAAALWEMPPDTVFFSDMTPTLARFGYRPATVMMLARKHRILICWKSQPSPQSRAFRVSTEDLDFRLEPVPGNRPYLSQLPAARRLQVPVPTLIEWLRHGLIP